MLHGLDLDAIRPDGRRVVAVEKRLRADRDARTLGPDHEDDAVVRRSRQERHGDRHPGVEPYALTADRLPDRVLKFHRSGILRSPGRGTRASRVPGRSY